MLSNRVYIICRDGVSEGQFYQVLLYELDAIRKVKLLLQDYKHFSLLTPPIFALKLEYTWVILVHLTCLAFS